MLAWRIPAVWKDFQTVNLVAPKNSKVLANQKKMEAAIRSTLDAVYSDIHEGLLETVGIDCDLVINECCSVRLNLPEGTDTKKIALAIDMENVETWCDTDEQVHIAISPWYSTKDIDQTVLCAVKVIHVLLGIHATDNQKPKSFKQKLISSVAEIISIQQIGKKR